MVQVGGSSVPHGPSGSSLSSSRHAQDASVICVALLSSTFPHISFLVEPGDVDGRRKNCVADWQSTCQPSQSWSLGTRSRNQLLRLLVGTLTQGFP